MVARASGASGGNCGCRGDAGISRTRGDERGDKREEGRRRELMRLVRIQTLPWLLDLMTLQQCRSHHRRYWAALLMMQTALRIQGDGAIYEPFQGKSYVENQAQVWSWAGNSFTHTQKSATERLGRPLTAIFDQIYPVAFLPNSSFFHRTPLSWCFPCSHSGMSPSLSISALHCRTV